MPALRVLLDATAVPAARGGVGRYVEELAAVLQHEVELVIACQRRDREVFTARAPRAELAVLPGWADPRPVRLLWEQFGLPLVARRLRVDVIHSPHYTMPLLAGRPVAVTLHDALFFSDREWHTGLKARFFRSWIKLSLRRAAVCVVDSAATGDELVRLAGADRDQLVVAHLGVDPARFHPPSTAEVSAAAASLELDDRGWIAFLATHEPRKNVPALVDGFVRSCTDRPDPPVLVLAGGAGWDTRIDGAIAAVPDHLTVLRPGYLPLSVLSGYLGGATVVAYPSLGEGFGIPVLEGMACGAAVLTTDRLSLPEVGGDAVAYTEPDGPAIGAALDTLLDDPHLRSELAARAVRRAADFTWDGCAQSCLAAYRTAVAGRRGRGIRGRGSRRLGGRRLGSRWRTAGGAG
ncbi:glycosyltransferase family 1 protein [Nakamurella sp. A5-74]|uniref:Glycosyltransferase family 1 protein n=1 Tax=Nakamurella sp. A5-74 TaxID=3158264 RepID=A0AAU8DKK7_9ACTN